MTFSISENEKREISPAVNFTDILGAGLLYKSMLFADFMCLQFGFVMFWEK